MSKNDWRFGEACRGYERRDLEYNTDRKTRGTTQPTKGLRTRVLEVYEEKGPEAAWEIVKAENKKFSGRGIEYTYQIFLNWIKEYKLKTRSINNPKGSSGRNDDGR